MALWRPHLLPEDASQTYLGPSVQQLEKSWDMPLGVDGAPIRNHLDRHALARYARSFGAALARPPTGIHPWSTLRESWVIWKHALAADGK